MAVTSAAITGSLDLRNLKNSPGLTDSAYCKIRKVKLEYSMFDPLIGDKVGPIPVFRSYPGLQYSEAQLIRVR